MRGPPGRRLPLLLTIAMVGALFTLPTAASEHGGPHVVIVQPEPGATVNGSVVVTGNASTDVGEVDRVEVRVDQGPWLSANGTSTWDLTWNSSTVPDGSHQIWARVTDGAGRVNRSAVNVTVANQQGNSGSGGNGSSGQDPDPTLEILEPEEGAQVQGNATIQGTAQASNGSVEAVFVRIDGGPWQMAEGTGAWSYTWDTTQVVNGSHAIQAKARAGGENSSVVLRFVQVVNEGQAPSGEPPQVTLTAPQDGAEVNGTVQVEGTAKDPDGDPVAWVHVRVDDGPWTNATGTDAWSYTWAADQAGQGEHTLAVRASDGQHVSEPLTRAVQVTASPQDGNATPSGPLDAPTLEVRAPTPRTTVERTVTIEGVAQVPGGEGSPVEIEARVDEGPWRSTEVPAGEPFSIDMNVGRLAQGDHTLQVRAQNAQGASNVHEVPISVSAGWSPGLGSAIVVLVLGGGGLLLWARE